MERKRRVNLNLIILLGIFALLTVLAVVFRKELFEFLSRLFRGEITRQMAKEFMRSFSWKGAIIIGFLSCLQILLTVLPAEPIQVVAGMAYGLPAGVALCMAGVVVGNIVMFILARTVGGRLTKYFQGKIHIDLNSGAAAGRLTLIIFVMYFLPAIPYGLICFMAASTGMKFYKYFLITTLCSLPSVIIGAALGVIALGATWIVSLVVFAVLIALIIVMFIFRNRIFAYVNAKIAKSALPHSTATTVRKPSRFILFISRIFVGPLLQLKTHFKYKKLNRQQREQVRGSVVICNHPSFIDWYYTGMGLYPVLGNFIIARYYFFHKRLAWLLRRAGGFPKSMFTADIESARNLLRVKKQGGTLCFMPEARLSTAGTTESIHIAGARMLQTLGLPVYAFHIDGAYLAKPKWAKGFRKGARVEMNFAPVLTAQEARELSAEQIHERVCAAVAYDDFEWLKTRPDLRYRDKNLAEGLENILFICPHCGAREGIETVGDRVCCPACGFTVRLGDRYGFEPSDRFANPKEWYEWQVKTLAGEIGDDYVLKDEVQVKLPSLDGKRFFRLSGAGQCTLSKEGFDFEGVLDGEQVKKHIPLVKLYRVLFGAGEDFEVYDKTEFYYFMPKNLRRCALWYAASGILYDKYCREES